ncbi:MAG TPA: hypothetical protein VNZ67_06455, partial [bacterium]|nr:hypothetical protein [bacterium]
GMPHDAAAGQVWDAFAPDVELFSFEIPQADADAFQGWVDLATPGPSLRRLDTAGAGFGRGQAGRRLDLGALLLRTQPSPLLRFSMGWPGWRLWIDGKERPWMRNLDLGLGAHRVQLRGAVPQGAQGPLPLRMEAGRLRPEEGLALLPWDVRWGMQTTYLVGPGRAEATCYDPLPFHRFVAPDALPAPYGIQMTGRLSVPEAGAWRLRARPPFPARVSVNGRTVFDSLGGGGESPVFHLGPGRPAALAVQGVVQTGALAEATVMLQVRGPGDLDWRPLPYDWVQAP